ANGVGLEVDAGDLVRPRGRDDGGLLVGRDGDAPGVGGHGDARDLDGALLGVGPEHEEQARVADGDEDAVREGDDLRGGAGEGDLLRGVVGGDGEGDAAEDEVVLVGDPEGVVRRGAGDGAAFADGGRARGLGLGLGLGLGGEGVFAGGEGVVGEGEGRGGGARRGGGGAGGGDDRGGEAEGDVRRGRCAHGGGLTPGRACAFPISQVHALLPPLPEGEGGWGGEVATAL